MPAAAGDGATGVGASDRPLGLYLGPLWKYYARGAMGGAPGAVSDPGEILARVLDWQSQLAGAFAPEVRGDLSWDETPTAPAHTLPLGWVEYGQLLRCLAHLDQGEAPPEQVVVEWGEDPVYRRSAAGASQGPWSQLLPLGLEFWLPWPLDFVLEVQDPAGQPVTVGSSVSLTLQLQRLGEELWGMDPEELEAAPEPASPVSRLARRAYLGLREAAGRAAVGGLVLKLDH